MNSCIEKLPWDTKFFSLPIGRIVSTTLDDDSVAIVLDEARKEGLRCLYFEADPNDLTTVETAEKNDFHLADVRVILEYPFKHHPAPFLRYPTPSKLIISTAVEADLPRLEDIAEETGQFSRFTFDRNFKPGEDKRLYRLWIKNSLGGFADVVFVARWTNPSEIVGLITCLNRDGVAHIQLAGVHHEHRMKGVGTGLVQAALDWGKTQDVQNMRVATQARNIPAQRLYQQMGFFTRSMVLIYHKWL